MGRKLRDVEGEGAAPAAYTEEVHRRFLHPLAYPGSEMHSLVSESGYVPPQTLLFLGGEA